MEGMYDWSYFDSEITKVAKAGKKVLLRISSGGKNTPEWVFDAGVQTFSFVDPQTNATITVPVWWDPIFLEKKRNFIAAMGHILPLIPTSCWSRLPVRMQRLTIGQYRLRIPIYETCSRWAIPPKN